MMLRARLASLLVAAAAAAGCASRPADANLSILRAHNLLRHTGYGALGPVSAGEVGEGGSHQLRATLGAGTCYVLAVFGSPGIVDLDVNVAAPDGSPVAEDRAMGPTGVVSFCAERSGEHLVTITAADGAGDFRMAYWFRRGGGGEGPGAPGGGANELVLGRAVSGMLPPGQTFVDYTMRLDGPRSVTIDLMSDEFDCYLYLLRDGMEIARDDDGGEGLNSRISRPLQPGAYVVRVGSFMNSGSGRFSLSAR